LVTKGTTPTSIGHSFVEEGVNFAKVESITTTGQFIKEKFAHITTACHAVLGRSQLQSGDILFSIAGALGRTGFVTDDILPANTNQALAIIRLKRDVGVLPKFVLKALETGIVLEQIEKFKGGVAQQNLSLAQVRDFQIALPPLAEQQRIVGLLDDAFEGLATAKANAEKNLQNARALFESHLQSVFIQRGPGWVDKPLGEVAEVQSGGTPSVPEKSYWGGNIPWYSSGELNETYTTDPERKITDTGLDNSNAKLFPKGSLLIGMYDTAALKMSILDRDGTFNQAIAGIKPNERIQVEFVLHAINAIKPRLLLERRGVRQKNLSLGKIKEIMIPIPAPTEQRAVVSSLRNIAAETRRLAGIYEQKLAALDALKKSLLHQAFSGHI
jgi:type I restriction enzyme S subunit